MHAGQTRSRKEDRGSAAGKGGVLGDTWLHRNSTTRKALSRICSGALGVLELAARVLPLPDFAVSSTVSPVSCR